MGIACFLQIPANLQCLNDHHFKNHQIELKYGIMTWTTLTRFSATTLMLEPSRRSMPLTASLTSSMLTMLLLLMMPLPTLSLLLLLLTIKAGLRFSLRASAELRWPDFRISLLRLNPAAALAWIGTLSICSVTFWMLPLAKWEFWAFWAIWVAGFQNLACLSDGSATYRKKRNALIWNFNLKIPAKPFKPAIRFLNANH